MMCAVLLFDIQFGLSDWTPNSEIVSFKLMTIKLSLLSFFFFFFLQNPLPSSAQLYI